MWKNKAFLKRVLMFLSLDETVEALGEYKWPLESFFLGKIHLYIF